MHELRMIRTAWLAALILLLAGVSRGSAQDWNKDQAAKFLDSRAEKWLSWGPASRDNGETVCISCHTSLPYFLSRHRLGQDLPAPHKALLANVKKRVQIWNTGERFYQFTPAKVMQSRGTEAVLYALILADQDARSSDGEPGTDTLSAFKHFWKTQIQEGEAAGGWYWLEFESNGYDPWESKAAEYYGTALAAIAVGKTPKAYYQSEEIKGRVALLRGYLKKRYKEQPPHNKLYMLWASTGLEGLLTPEERTKLIDEILAIQESDGGWNLARLFGKAKKRSGDPVSKASDGHATGLVIYVLKRAEVSRDNPKLRKGVSWLTQAQEKESGATRGSWAADSLNRVRNNSDSAAWWFMRDAASGFAVLALTEP